MRHFSKRRPSVRRLLWAAVALALILLLSSVTLSSRAVQPAATAPQEAWALGSYMDNASAPLTRALLAKSLYAVAEGGSNGQSAFTDVPDAACYRDAAVWAVSRGIMGVYSDGSFRPYDDMTREEMVTALWRYARTRGFDTSGAADLSGYTDLASVSAYAQEPFAWAVAASVIVGVGADSLGPGQVPTCAQLTAALVRLYSGTTGPGRAFIAVASDAAAGEYARAVHKVSFLSLGDNLYHGPVIESGRQADGGYDFDSIYTAIKPYVEAADLACINQETMFVSDPAQYSGYPTFGTPYAVADSVVRTGFDIVTQASNHTLDKGTGAISAMVGFWRTNHPQMTVLGVHDVPESRVDYVEKNGVKIAMLCYCYGLNGLTLPSGSEYMVDLLTLGEDVLAADMAEAENNADCTLVFMHAGTEYQYAPDATQTRWAAFFAEHGAEVIIGTHPHVLEPLAYIQTSDGRSVPCYYSLGNLVSNQQEYPRWLGGMATFDIVMDGGAVTVTDVRLSPTFTHIYSANGISNYRAYLLKDYTNELAAQHLYAYMFGASTDMIWSLYSQITAGG